MASPARVWLPILMWSAILLASTGAHAAQYVVDGFALSEPVTTASPNYRSYTCKPSDDFADSTQCLRTQERGSRGSGSILSSALIHAADGTTLYAMVNIAPVQLNRAVVQGEIDALSRQFNERPAKVEWTPAGNGMPATVLAIWGQIKVEEIGNDAINLVANGENPHLGVLVGALGDPKLTLNQNLPVYRLTGGSGYLYSASFDARGRGHRRYVAANATELAIKQFRVSLQAILEKDLALARDDYRLWPDVALITRNLARDTSPRTANAAIDKVFDETHNSKLRSHVWAYLPLGARERLAAGEYSRLDIYGPKTEHPVIRRDIEGFLAREPSDPFVEFGYSLIGDYEKALQVRPNSVIADVLHYAAGHKIMLSLLQDGLPIAKTHVTRTTSPNAKSNLEDLVDEGPDAAYHFDRTLKLSNQNPDFFERKRLGSVIPNFVARATVAQAHFAAVLRHPTSPLADDAAYMTGWLLRQQGKSKEALPYYSQAMSIGNRDYQDAALKETVRTLEEFPVREQLATVQGSQVFSQHPPLLYAAARSAYRDFEYALAIEAAQRALKQINLPIERLPMTTDAKRIEAAIEKINADLAMDPNVIELPYLIAASQEISRYEAYLNRTASESPDALARNARNIIAKFSMLVDRPPQATPGRSPAPLEHKDLRQALHMIDLTLQNAPKSAQYLRLREWLLYRRIRVLAVFSPDAVPQAIAALQQEFPASKLLDDALAEQIFAEGITAKNVDAAQKTFRDLLGKYPNGNALDNAHSWMAIALRCADRRSEAQSMNREIIRRFPMTRHAKYARDRLAHPDRGIDDHNCGWH